MDFRTQLERLRLIVVTGKGGVGKSACAAVLGTLLARAGRRCLVLEVDPRENVHQMLGVAPSGGAIVPAAAARLYLQNLRPRQVIDEVVRERLRIEFLVRRILASPVYHQFADTAPGLRETAVLSHVLLLLEGRVAAAPELDVVVLDAPATGHGVSLLTAPGLVAEAIERGPVAELTGQVAALVDDPGRTGIVVVTQAEEMPVSEALELRAELRRRLDRDPELLVVNQLLPPDPPARRPKEDPLVRLWRQRRRFQERELARLGSGWPGQRLELPLLATGRGPALIQGLAAAALGKIPWT